MSIGSTLIAYLIAQVSTAQDRVYPITSPTDSCPYIVVTQVSTVRLMTHQGYTGSSRIRWQVSVFDTDFKRCRQTADAVVTALEAWPSAETKVGYALHAGESAFYESDTKKYHIPVDFQTLCET